MYLLPSRGGGNVNEIVGEGFDVQQEQNSWNRFGKQLVGSIDKEIYLTQAQDFLFRPIPFRRPEQMTGPL